MISLQGSLIPFLPGLWCIRVRETVGPRGPENVTVAVLCLSCPSPSWSGHGASPGQCSAGSSTRLTRDGAERVARSGCRGGKWRSSGDFCSAFFPSRVKATMFPHRLMRRSWRDLFRLGLFRAGPGPQVEEQFEESFGDSRPSVVLAGAFAAGEPSWAFPVGVNSYHEVLVGHVEG